MDPQSVVFQPQNDLWRIQNELQRIQTVQSEHSDRILRIERKQDDDARMKSVWGGASPFPGILSSTPQQTPLHHPSSDAFKNFDDESTNLIGSLHLDPEEEPRRMGATSRANSVRFDESANQGWNHTSRSSMDLMRSGGGIPMSERTSSHKSDGRASSVHSLRSAASGRANSLNLDTGFSFGDSNRSPVDTPGLAPGLFLLGSVPAIIRCWMNTTFRHDALKYAAVCTGSHKSFLDRRLVDKLGFTSRINITTAGVQTLVLPVYLPEAVPHPTSTRSGSPAPQLPTLTVTFTVVPSPMTESNEDKGIQIILGSDTLRVHNADILFSSNNLSLFDDDRNKISIPLVRPEDERTFNVLQTTSTHVPTDTTPAKLEETEITGAKINGLGQSNRSSAESVPSLAAGVPIGSQRRTLSAAAQAAPVTEGAGVGATDSSDDEDRLPTGRSIRFAQLPQEVETAGSETTPQTKDDFTKSGAPARTASSPAIWSNWRQRTNEPTQTSTMDYASASKAKEPTPRKESGIRVLRPMKSASRTFSATSTSSGTTSDSKSRFFDEGKRRSTMDSMSGEQRGESAQPTDMVDKVAGTTESQSKKRKTIARELQQDSLSRSELPPNVQLFAPEVNHPDRQPSPSPGSSSPFPVTNTSRGTSPSLSLGQSGILPPTDLSSSASRFLDGIDQAADSPSDAYAELTLASSGNEENMSGSYNEDASDVNACDVKSNSQGRLGEKSLGRRSASPAKRSAAAMEGHEEVSAGPQDSVKSPTDTNMVDAEATSQEAQQSAGSIGQDDDLTVIDERVQKIFGLTQTEITVEEAGYLVAYKWLARVLSRSTEMRSSQEWDVDATEGPIGAIDNASVVPIHGFEGPHLKFDKTDKEFIPLKPQFQRGVDFEVFPQAAWDLIVEWYGLHDGQLPVIRYAKDTAPEGSTQKNIQYENYPPVFTIRKMLSSADKSTKPPSPPGTNNPSQANTVQTTPERESQAVKLVASRQDRFQTFLARSKRAAGIPMEHKVRPWRQTNTPQVAVDPSTTNRPGMPTPAASRTNSPGPEEATQSISTSLPSLVLARADFDKMPEGSSVEQIDCEDNTANLKYNGKMTLDTLGLIEDQTLILEEQVRGPAGGEFISDAKRKQQKAEEAKAAARDSDASTAGSGPVTRGRTRKSGRSRGTIGLQNLGNTCYMNSALQCISRIEELAWYFLTAQWKKEINADNPLGYHGNMARSFADFLSGLYKEGAQGCFTPRQFKNALAAAQPMFSGYGQQDSQEFLSFLVDALHEDLNRIQKKPYLENPDSDDNRVHDPEYIKELGEKYRENHRARNDSIAMDLFSGFYRNTMVCPACDKISVTFDPFSLLTVQLPIESTWQHKVFYIPNKGRPIMHLLDLDKSASIRTFKQRFAEKVGTKAENLFVGEFFSNRLYKVWKDGEPVSEIAQNDVIAVFEFEYAPTNISKGKAYRSMLSPREDDIPDMDSPLAEHMAVTVINRTRSRLNSFSPTYHPMVVMVTREEAKDFDAIMKKILGQVAKYTSRDILSDDAAQLPTTKSNSRRSSDSGLISGTESAEQVDAKLSDRSVPSEDEYVNVSMRDGSSPINADEDLPEALRSGTSIPTSLRSLFEVGYFPSPGGDFNCTGNSSSIDAAPMQGRVHSGLSRRSSVASLNSVQTGSTEQSTTSAQSRASSPGQDEDEKAPSTNGITSHHFAGDVQSDDDGLNFTQPSDMVENQFKAANRSKFDKRKGRGGKKKQITYSKKNNSRHNKGVRAKPDFHSTSSPRSPKENTDDDPYFIKLGEGIVLDWTDEGWDALFGGTPRSSDDERGHQLIDERVLEAAEDPELEAKLEKRRRRKKEGVSLDDCFAETAKTETLSEENAWYCNRCKELRRADKTLMIWTAPDILVVHLKRFSGERFRRDKVDVLVDFPLEGLDLSNRVGLKEDGRDYIYDLFAVDNHYGGLGGGHYTAYAKNFFDGKWYDFNDSFVSQQSSPSSVITPAAYLLFYRRRSPQPLGPAYLRDLVTSARAASDAASDDEDETAGEGRLGDSSLLRGSSSASGVKAGAGGRTLGGSSGGETGKKSASRLLLPGAGGVVGREATSRIEDEDEGIGMETDNGDRQTGLGEQGAGWSFSGIDGAMDGVENQAEAGLSGESTLNGSGNGSDGDSTRPELGDDEAYFGDEVVESTERAGSRSPSQEV
ncbi:ubiquitin carboxyl-terminal hydrolase-like protein 3 [Elsinoe australis]|uniref:ubiquitinyl hydrolase 1 n=1 Tax=Elsinoe australis TaxID=40998 RepID=A0A4U7BB10_9PEZI|nr:ubiquitin carboxyl-terminal hydrolase-like protein 3 [Elsinoe australis]